MPFTTERDAIARERREIAAYVAMLTRELAIMARGSGHKTLAFVLAMASEEAAAQAQERE